MSAVMLRLDATISVPRSVCAEAERQAGPLARVWERTPVYLVSPALMDELCPPSERRFFPTERVCLLVKSHRERVATSNSPPRWLADLDPLWHDLSSAPRSSRSFVASGVFLSAMNSNQRFAVERRAGRVLPSDRGIFLCPERLLESTRSSETGAPPSRRFSLLLRAALFHELAHALLDSAPTATHTPEGLVLEESFCTALALARFDDTAERRAILQELEKEPAEYRAGTYWNVPWRHLLSAARAWARWSRSKDPLAPVAQLSEKARRRLSRLLAEDVVSSNYLLPQRELWWKVAKRLLVHAAGGPAFRQDVGPLPRSLQRSPATGPLASPACSAADAWPLAS